MKSINIENKPEFFKRLTEGGSFDSFLMVSVKITGKYTLEADGRLNNYKTEPSVPDNTDEFVTWKEAKHLLSGFADTKKFKLVLSLTKDQVKKLSEKSESSVTYEQIEGLYINIVCENEKIVCTTGTSLKTFTMDKSLEEYYDKYTLNFLSRIDVKKQEAL